MCCFLFCKALLLAIAQLSCLLAQAMEADLAFPFRSRAYGGQLCSLRNLHSLDTASAWGWAGALPKAQRIPEMVMSGCRTLDVTLPHRRGAGLRRLMAMQGRMWFGMRSNVEQKASGIGSTGLGVLILGRWMISGKRG